MKDGYPATLAAVSTLALALTMALAVSTAGCLDVDEAPSDANATPTPEQKAALEIELNIDASERGRIMAEAVFRNTGNSPIDGLSGNITFAHGNETIAVDRVNYDRIGAGETRSFSKFYNVDSGDTYQMRFDLETGLGPIKKNYRIET